MQELNSTNKNHEGHRVYITIVNINNGRNS